MPGHIPPVKYTYLVLIEPSLLTKETFDANYEARQGALDFLRAATLKRRDTWADREKAMEYFKIRLPWNTWDPRVLEIYVVSV